MTQTPQELLMKLVTISMQLVIDDEDVGSDYDNIAQYLTDKLYTDPEFFGDFGSENILEIKEFV
jgi:hypothetical protein